MISRIQFPCELAEKYRPIYEKQAKANHLNGLKQNQNAVAIDVRAKLARTVFVEADLGVFVFESRPVAKVFADLRREMQ